MINPSSNMPIYVQIAEQVKSQILSGTLKTGEQVMSTTAYAQAYRINPATVQKAFAALLEEGVVEKRRGLGTFVAAGARDSLLAAGRRKYHAEVLLPAIQAGLILGMSGKEISAQVESALREETQAIETKAKEG